MTHFFNVEIATDYGIEKAVLLNNIFYWCKENEANGRNVHEGRAYTYNTAEAYAALFPYFKPRKIAELLRQLEAEDLIISRQDHSTNRVKSYALTDKALAYYSANIQNSVSCNIQKNDNGTYRKTTMEHTEMRQCSITDKKQQIINTDIEGASAPKTPKTRSVSYLRALPINEQYALVSQYAKEAGLEFDVSYFVDWWTARNWTPKGRAKPLSDWQAAARTWAKRETQYNAPKNNGTLWGQENNCADKYKGLFEDF